MNSKHFMFCGWETSTNEWNQMKNTIDSKFYRRTRTNAKSVPRKRNFCGKITKHGWIWFECEALHLIAVEKEKETHSNVAHKRTRQRPVCFRYISTEHFFILNKSTARARAKWRWRLLLLLLLLTAPGYPIRGIFRRALRYRENKLREYWTENASMCQRNWHRNFNKSKNWLIGFCCEFLIVLCDFWFCFGHVLLWTQTWYDWRVFFFFRKAEFARAFL